MLRSASSLNIAIAGTIRRLRDSTGTTIRAQRRQARRLPGCSGLCPAFGLRGSRSWQDFAIQLIGVQACISVWRQFDYLFSAGGSVGGQAQRSDTGAIADVLVLPYWFWGAVISVGILGLLWWSFRVAFRR